MVEKDPILREIYALGYDKIEEDIICNCIRLVDTNSKYIKCVNLSDYKSIIAGLEIISGSNLAGGIHKWISEQGYYTNTFRKMISRDDKQ